MIQSLIDYFKVRRQYLLPQHALSRFGGKVSHCKLTWLKNFLIRWFIKRYQVNMAEALESDPQSYSCFHDFFIRPLKPGVRIIAPGEQTICSPCDGTISQLGSIQQGSLLQAKGRTFSVAALLGNPEIAAQFQRGHFLTIYLAPKDYHRVHMPFAGNLQRFQYIPGKLFSVNPLTTCSVENLFARNERVVSCFESQGRPFAVILVGAMIVGSISLRWAGPVSSKHNETKPWYPPQAASPRIKLDKGEEMGYFAL